ncbi:MAG: cyclic nucleotide-binding domain-containing protein [Deltaproteobacteria bacterium]|nr:cyclic nucleotide-binding domain-containing protein [Deltaproteobacteria bacterium]
MKKLLEKYLKVYSHEFSKFAWLAAIFFVIFFVTAIFRTYVDAAFLKRYGPDYIPMMLVINALLTFVVLGVVDRLSRRYLDHFLLSGFLGCLGVMVFILFWMVKSGFSIAYPILYQLLYLLDSILLVYLWNMAGDLFDTRQGKRIFPLVTMSQVLGTTTGSFITKPVTLLIGEDPTLLVFAVVCLATAFFLGRTGPEIFKGQKPKAASTTARGDSGRIPLSRVPSLIAEYPMVRYLIVTGLIPNILLPIFLYQFSVIANHTFASEQALISFLSIFRGMTTLMTFVLLFFVGRLYSTMGLANASLVHPINFALLFGSLQAFFNIYVACYGQFTAILIQRAISGPVNKILYNVLPKELIAWSRTFIRGTVLKVGMLAGSMSMIILKPVVDARSFSYLAFVLSIWWVVETLIFRRHYKRILKQVIAEKEIDFDQVESVRAFDSGGAAMELGPVPVEDRTEEAAAVGTGKAPAIEPEVALKMMDDPNPNTRAEAAASFAMTQDVRAVRKLVQFLDDTDIHIRNAAIEALIAYRDKILPYLEVSLIDSTPRIKQGILEVIRLSGLKGFEVVPFLAKELNDAYSNLVVLRRMQSESDGVSITMLKEHLRETNDEILRLIFYALWVYHADMRLIYNALKSETASIAVELVENSIEKEITPYLIPLIEDVPLDEKIEKGRQHLPLIRKDNPERLLTFLAESDDPVTRIMALFVIAEHMPYESFIPVIEQRLTDEDRGVQELARYALARTRNEVAQMPEIIEMINKLRNFTLFEDMGIRELHAIATVLKVERFNAGDLMIVEGEENSTIYLVMSGSVRIVNGWGTPDEKERAVIGAGSFLGELSMFTRMPPNATCIAAEETEAFLLPHHQFIEIMRVYPQIGINLCRFFSMKCRQAIY